MRFRVLKEYGRYWPQVYKKLWNGVCWGDGWEAIGPNYGFDNLAGAKLRCNAYMEDNRPEVIEEFEL